ncbi:DUF6443 domain-containing protein, partial [Ascidiimonas aurantiaca]|uniref:DUF6443 domain-containing protein n=1 Tax=Ascidiimonas aurantiaca TaxID=1685432 RepID=UPI0030EE1C3C
MKNLVRMKNPLFIFCTVFTISLMSAQIPTTIVKGGATDYIVTGNDTLIASQSITLTPLSWIQAGSNFTATVISDPYIAISRSNQNYIYSREYMTAMADSNGIRENRDVLESLVYYDGLGRPKQQIAIKQSPDKNDLITHVAYDAFGRKTREYLSYEETTQIPGTLRTGDIHAATQNFYKSHYPDDFPFVAAQANPYSETLLENSPLNRTLQQAAPGEVWKLGNGHEIEMAYNANTSGEVRHFKVSFAGNDPQAPQLSVAAATHYPAGFLYKNTTRDENHPGTATRDHTTEEFTDKQGRVVLKRTYANETAHDTYYVYDSYGNLTFVIPPKVITTDGVSTTELNELCYQYIYDRRNRLIEKKIPGKGWEFIVYNTLDQPIMTQDSMQRTQNRWLFTKYDRFGRVVYSGLYTAAGAASRTSVQADAENIALFSPTVSYSSIPQSLGGAQVYYSNNAFPVTGITEVYSINYYDDYNDFDKAGFTVPAGINGQTVTSQTQGLATASQTKVLGTASDWITTLMGYDQKGRMIWSGSRNTYLDTRDETETTLDFPGRITQLVTRHTKGTSAVIVTTEQFTYDHTGRPLAHTHQTGSGSKELLAYNRYDALGQLTQKNVGNTISTPLQQIIYNYNVRGWLKGINDVNSTIKLFNFSIRYNDPQNGATPLYNGNISETHWRTANTDSSLKHYRYTYDALNRLVSANHSNPNYTLG